MTGKVKGFGSVFGSLVEQFFKKKEPTAIGKKGGVAQVKKALGSARAEFGNFNPTGPVTATKTKRPGRGSTIQLG